VVIVAPMVARNDAISAAVRDTYDALNQDSTLETTILTTRNDFEHLRAQHVSDVGSLLLHPAYREADLLIYHFGVFHGLFNALILGNGHARQVVRFHNVTPLEFAGPTQRDVVKASFGQIGNIERADEIWCDSTVNKQALEALDIAGNHIHVIPLIVQEPDLSSLSTKSTERVELLFVGRAVPSKGLLDLVAALDRARLQSTLKMRLRIAGSLEWSDPAYLNKIRALVEEQGLEDMVEFCGVVDDRTRDRLYAEAHILAIPSYHEGFCKPVVEGLRAGCVPVGYSAYNTPFTAGGLGRMVTTGDIDALATAIARIAGSVSQAIQAPELAVLPLDSGTKSLRAFEMERDAHVEQYTFQCVAPILQSHTRVLLDAPTASPAMHGHTGGLRVGT
jgi:glycosyltransferase involved in cell wall biosynthesis